MAVNELDRDYLQLLHQVDAIDNIINGFRLNDETDEEKKRAAIAMVQMIESELLDSKYTDGGKDIAPLSAGVARGRTYWKSTD